MFSFYSRLLWVLGAIVGVLDTVQADNPIIQSIYTADPAPVVVGDRIYLLADHDENGSTTYNMKDWRLFSTAVGDPIGQHRR
jgi:arabinoxylan arabinofuranohydrolase